METTITNKTNFRMDAVNFEKVILEMIEKIKKYADFMDYQIIGDLNELENLKYHLSDLSLNQRKKLRNLLLKANYSMSLRSINRFLHFLYKNILHSDKRVRIKVSEKEEEIQKLRKEWIENRDKTKVALFLYKETKGDFYKDKNKKFEIAKNL